MHEELFLSQLNVNLGGRCVVKDATLNVKPGEIVALLGANGAGKSSLLMAAIGHHPTASGHVQIGSVQCKGFTPDVVRKYGVSLVPEGHLVLGDLTVAENLEVAAITQPIAEAKTSIEKAIAILPELKDLLNRQAELLSGGQKQMLAIAQALISKPKFLLIDELSLGLAPVVVRRLSDALVTIAETGVGILIVEQFSTVALKIASRAYVMELGKIVFGGSAEELRKRPDILHSAYLGSKN